jgi:sigma-54 dependent transcriptional regulator, acetoin dehydrogenase operon transcriptional activator AcoR
MSNSTPRLPPNVIESVGDLLASHEDTIEWLFSILNSVNNGILIVDDALIVRYINPEYTSITGVTSDQIVGRVLREVRPGAMLPDVVRTGRPISGLIRREKDIEYVVDLAPIIFEKKIKGGIGIFKNITEFQRLSKELQRMAKQKERLKSIVQNAFKAKYTFDDTIGESESIQKVIHFAKRFAQSRHDILITGESGTGKEVLAQAIHSASDRPSEPFITVNCGALAPTLLESELFGYSEGAFTGAKKGGKVGLFEIAEGGTIFLDEIAEMTVEMQSRFLRVLQEKTIRRIGDTQQTPLDVRVITATNRDLNEMVQQNLFRHDLYFRLNVLNIHVPPLRERLDDIRLLADHFLANCNRKSKRKLEFDFEVYERFSKYAWPGNVRELFHTIQFAAEIAEDSTITIHHLPKTLNPDTEPEWLERGTLSEAIRDFERKVITARIKYYGKSRNAKTSVARDLGISRATLYNKIRYFCINKSKSIKN